jgi:hypothetical protein
VNVYYFKALGSIDEFVGQVLETKCRLISSVVDGGAMHPEATEDALGELERALGALAIDGTKKLTGAQIDNAFDQVVATYAQMANEVVTNVDPLHKPKQAGMASIQALARALSPRVATTKYRIKATEQLKWYELEVDGADVVCSCRGFEFRGQCKHARILKDALASGEDIPDAYQRVE